MQGKEARYTGTQEEGRKKREGKTDRNQVNGEVQSGGAEKEINRNKVKRSSQRVCGKESVKEKEEEEEEEEGSDSEIERRRTSGGRRISFFLSLTVASLAPHFHQLQSQLAYCGV